MKTIKTLLMLLLFIGFSSCKDEIPPPVDDITVNDPIDDPIDDDPIEDDPIDDDPIEDDPIEDDPIEDDPIDDDPIEDDPIDTLPLIIYNEYYVAGYEPCGGVSFTGETGIAKCYVLVSTNMKDTVFTYNFPKDVFDFPKGCFPRYFSTPTWFPTEYQKLFKVYIEYDFVPKGELNSSICPDIMLILNVNSLRQISIKSATKIN